MVGVRWFWDHGEGPMVVNHTCGSVLAAFLWQSNLCRRLASLCFGTMIDIYSPLFNFNLDPLYRPPLDRVTDPAEVIDPLSHASS